MGKNNWIDSFDFEDFKDSKPIKTISYIAVGLVVVVSAGLVLKLSARTIMCYKEFRNALKS